MSATDSNPPKRRTTSLLPEMEQSAKRVSNNALLRLVRHLNSPIAASEVRPSKSLHQRVYIGVILGLLSIITSFLYIVGFLFAIFGLLIGIYGRRKSPALHLITSWTIGLCLTGLALSVLFLIISIHW